MNKTFIVLAAAFATAARAQVARIEVHPFASTTLTDQQFLTGVKEGAPAQLAAELRIPQLGTSRLPAVVLVHGSGGVGANVHVWSQALNGMGIATLILDSFTGRKILHTLNDQSQLSRTAMIADEYRALELLSRHPRIDPARIAVMGFSRGGMAALYASMRRFQRMHAPPDASYAAYVAFYPPCYTTFIDDADVADRPIRIFHGTSDDYVPVAGCRAYVARLRAAGKDVQLTEYAGAYHAFDSPFYKEPTTLAQAQTARKCVLEEETAGRIVNRESRAPFTWNDPCVERGPTIGYNEKATAEATKAVKAFLTAAFKLQVSAQK